VKNEQELKVMLADRQAFAATTSILN